MKRLYTQRTSAPILPHSLTGRNALLYHHFISDHDCFASNAIRAVSIDRGEIWMDIVSMHCRRNVRIGMAERITLKDNLRSRINIRRLT